MKTISIGIQESAVELASAFAAALAAEIGWTADGATVKKDGVPVYFTFDVSNTNIHTRVSNGYVSEGATTSSFSAAKSYELYVVKTSAGTVAVGTRESGGIPCLTAIIAPNTSGDYVGLAQATTSSPSWSTIRGTDTAKRNHTFVLNNGEGVSTSIDKMPDIWSDAMYKDLYMIVSCPFRSTDLVFFIGEKYYRGIGASNSYMSIAIPEV